jgi:hypothetical protein
LQFYDYWWHDFKIYPITVNDFVSQVRHFLTQHHLTFSETADFGLPFSHFYFPENQLIVHCVSLFSALNNPFVFQEITNQIGQRQQRIVHLWEDVWFKSPEIVQSRLLASLGHSQRISARLTQARRIDKATLDAFLTTNHLQASTNAKLKYGLFLPQKHFSKIKSQEKFGSTMIYTGIIRGDTDNDDCRCLCPHRQLPSCVNQRRTEKPQTPEKLVAVASFSSLKTYWRTQKPCRSAELIRFCNLLNCTVVGGLDKLLKTFIEETNPDDLMTYADRDWSDGRSYQRLGFELIEQTHPQAFWVDSQTFERHKHPHSTSNLVKIYNAGNLKFLKKIK